MSKVATFPLALSEAMREHLRVVAFERRTTMSQLIRDAIQAQVPGADQIPAAPHETTGEA